MRVSVLLLLFLVLACTPRAKAPPSADSVLVDTTTAPTDTAETPDSLVWPKDYQPDTAQLRPADLQALRTIADLPVQLASYTDHRVAPITTGLPFGMSGYKPLDKLCAASTVINGTDVATDPGFVAASLAAADKCGFHYAITFSRRLMTTNGVWNGPFSLTKAKQLVDRYATALPAAKYQDYTRRGVLLFFYTLDDMGCPQCWGGTAITQQTTAEFTKYAQAKLGALAPIFLRVHPEWMLRNGATRATWAMPDGRSSVDVVRSQWYKIFQTYRPYPTQQQWYANQAKAQATLGVPFHSYTVTYGGCYRAADVGCSAADIQKLGLIANATPGNCANIGWNWRDEFAGGDYLKAIKVVAADAASRPTVLCRPPTSPPPIPDPPPTPIDTSATARILAQPEFQALSLTLRTTLAAAIRRVLGS